MTKKLRTFGSQGEHKIALVIIKLAEYLFIKKQTGASPTLLLDDLFAKLDLKRSDAVFELLKKKTQTIITNTDLFNLKNHGIDLGATENQSFHLER
jgi:DNA replication and repair protein RecF